MIRTIFRVRRHIATAVAIAHVSLLTVPAAQAAGSSMPWEAPLQAILESIEGPVAEIVVRNWGALIGLMGVLLICGAFREQIRTVALLVAGTSKVIFIALVLSLGQPFLPFQVGVSIVVDTLMVVLFASYLIAERFSPQRAG